MSDTQVHSGNRREDPRLITGRGRYTSDWNLPGQLHAAFLRSDRAHAEIESVNAVPALKRPYVVAVFTGADAVAEGYMRFPTPNITNRRGEKLLKTERPVLAHGKVRFVGEAVAMVIAESPLAAQDALDAIDVEYRELPVAVTIDDALAPSAPQLHTAIPGNLGLEWEAGDADEVGKAFKHAAHVTRIKVATTRVVPSPMEPRSYVVSYEAANESYDIYTSAQGMNLLRDQIATLTGVASEKLTLHLHDVGGSFGQRTNAYPEHAALMMAAKKLGRPIKWVSSRSEGFLSDAHGRGVQTFGELALDGDGNFLAARYNLACDMGAYLTPSGPSGPLGNGSQCMTGVYRTSALYGHFKIVFTNATPMAAYRGAGRPDISYVIERLVDKAASELKLDRAELRRRNFIPLDSFPYKSMTGGVYERSDFAGCLDKALKTADWAGFESRRLTAHRAGKLRGIGLAVVIEGTGAGKVPIDQVALEVDSSGKLVLYTVTLAGGQGHETTFPEVVAQTLGIAPEAVTLRQCVIGKDLIGNNLGGSGALIRTGTVCKLAAEKLILQARPFAAEALELEPSQIEYGGGAFRSSDGEKMIGLLDLAQRHVGKNPHPFNLIAEGKGVVTFPNGCHIAEVEIDPETGITIIISYVAVDDCGRAINHSIVEGQVHGGVTQGAGQIFGEHAVYDRDSGQLLTGSFSDYFMPHAGLIRDIHMDEHPVPSKKNNLEAKGVGESGCTASLPTLGNAMMDALRRLGIDDGDIDMPFTPSKVWHAIQASKELYIVLMLNNPQYSSPWL